MDCNNEEEKQEVMSIHRSDNGFVFLIMLLIIIQAMSIWSSNTNYCN